MTIHDLTLKLKPGMPIYPGNPSLQFTPHQTIPQDSSNSTLVSFGTHTGTHLDAPSHVRNDDITIDQIPLKTLIGPCRVLDLSPVTDAVKIEHLEPYNIQPGERILTKTHNSVRGWETWYDDYVYLDGDAADYLAEIGIILYGIDYFSVKQRGSKDHRPHDSLLNIGIPVLESLDFSQVGEGTYNLTALPLPLEGLDGSPVRAILTN